MNSYKYNEENKVWTGKAPLVDIRCIENTGVWFTHELKEDEAILGIYGCCNSAKNIRGLGFMIWKPTVQR
jgi:hypothetical protein